MSVIQMIALLCQLHRPVDGYVSTQEKANAECHAYYANCYNSEPVKLQESEDRLLTCMAKRTVK